MNLTFSPNREGINSSHRKENYFKGAFMLVELKTGDIVAEIRYYRTKTADYAVFWEETQKAAGSGMSRTEGRNEAICRAAKAAGLKFEDRSFSATEILESFAAYIGKGCKVIQTHA